MIMRSRVSAFTLIELLVVMAIIVALAGIAVPMLFSATETGNRTNCMRNLREIYQALLEYKSRKTNNRGYPQYDGKQFLAALYRSGVLEDARVFVCPTVRSRYENDPGEKLGGLDSDERAEVPPGCISYAGRLNSKTSSYSITAVRMKRPRDAATKIALASDGLERVDDQWAFPHVDVVEVLFLDGHVETLDVEKNLEGARMIGKGAPAPLDGLGNE